jgi:predicted DNA-binding transcriptional regulator YafY
MTVSHRALPDAHTGRGVFFAIMDSLKQFNKPLDDYIGIYNSPVWPNDGIQLPTELGEAIYSNKRIFIRYVNGEGEQSERWITPKQVMGLSDYVYLKAHCHLRKAERNFRLDRIIEVKVEVER